MFSRIFKKSRKMKTNSTAEITSGHSSALSIEQQRQHVNSLNNGNKLKKGHQTKSETNQLDTKSALMTINSATSDDSCAINELLEGRMDLIVNLPKSIEVNKIQLSKVTINVERRQPMMDLLVNIATQFKLNAANYKISAGGHDYKANTPIGSLDVKEISIVPKTSSKRLSTQSLTNSYLNLTQISPTNSTSVTNSPTTPNNSIPFQTTFRLQVNLPRNQLMVFRASPSSTISQVKQIVCDEKHLDYTKYELVVCGEREPQILNVEKTLAFYAINEITLMSIKAITESQLQYSNTSSSVADSPTTDTLPCEPKKVILSLLSATNHLPQENERKESVEKDKRLSLPNQPAKKRPAPPPPSQAVLSMQNRNSLIINEKSHDVNKPNSLNTEMKRSSSSSIINKQTSLTGHRRQNSESDSSGYHESMLSADSPELAITATSTTNSSSRASTGKSAIRIDECEEPLSLNQSSSLKCQKANKKRKAPAPPPPSKQVSPLPSASRLSKQTIDEINASSECLSDVSIPISSSTSSESTISVPHLCDYAEINGRNLNEMQIITENDDNNRGDDDSEKVCTENRTIEQSDNLINSDRNDEIASTTSSSPADVNEKKQNSDDIESNSNIQQFNSIDNDNEHLINIENKQETKKNYDDEKVNEEKLDESEKNIINTTLIVTPTVLKVNSANIEDNDTKQESFVICNENEINLDNDDKVAYDDEKVAEKEKPVNEYDSLNTVNFNLSISANSQLNDNKTAYDGDENDNNNADDDRRDDHNDREDNGEDKYNKHNDEKYNYKEKTAPASLNEIQTIHLRQEDDDNDAADDEKIDKKEATNKKEIADELTDEEVLRINDFQSVCEMSSENEILDRDNHIVKGTLVQCQQNFTSISLKKTTTTTKSTTVKKKSLIAVADEVDEQSQQMNGKCIEVDKRKKEDKEQIKKSDGFKKSTTCLQIKEENKSTCILVKDETESEKNVRLPKKKLINFKIGSYKNDEHDIYQQADAGDKFECSEKNGANTSDVKQSSSFRFRVEPCNSNVMKSRSISHIQINKDSTMVSIRKTPSPTIENESISNRQLTNSVNLTRLPPMVVVQTITKPKGDFNAIVDKCEEKCVVKQISNNEVNAQTIRVVHEPTKRSPTSVVLKNSSPQTPDTIAKNNESINYIKITKSASTSFVPPPPPLPDTFVNSPVKSTGNQFNGKVLFSKVNETKTVPNYNKSTSNQRKYDQHEALLNEIKNFNGKPSLKKVKTHTPWQLNMNKV